MCSAETWTCLDRAIIDGGANPNVEHEGEEDPTIRSVEKLNEGVVELLLTNNITVGTQKAHGETTLRLAACYRQGALLIINMMRIFACDSGKKGGLDAHEKAT